MKLTISIFMIPAILASILNCSEQRPKGWKDAMSFSNPLATFQPSIISKGHVHFFGSIDQLSHQQKQDLEKLLTCLGVVKILETAVAGLIVYAQRPKMLFGLSLVFGIFNIYYLFQLKTFKGKLDEAIHDEKE